MTRAAVPPEAVSSDAKVVKNRRLENPVMAACKSGRLLEPLV
jgi:hypothetical protein